MFASRQGLQSLLKEGSKQYTGCSEVLLKNIDACKAIVAVTQTSLGPDGMSKLLVNHLEKRTVTSDASTILGELDIQHPAAKLLMMAAKMQDQEYGDGTNFLLSFAGDLLTQTEYLVTQGIHICDIISGFETAQTVAQNHLKNLPGWTLSNIRDPEEIAKGIKTAMSAKVCWLQDSTLLLVATAIVTAMPPNPRSFNVDTIRTCKIVGRSIEDSFLVNGMLVSRAPSGKIERKGACSVMVMACGLEMGGTEAKGTVLFKNAEEMMKFSNEEEDQIEAIIKGIAAKGVGAIIVNGAISDLAQHFCNNNDILTLKVTSKFETKRLCQTLGATAMIRLGIPTAEELGSCESIGLQEVASKMYTSVKGRNSKIVTLALRGSTPSQLDEVERAIEDAVYSVKAVLSNPKFVAGAGATEMQLASHLQQYATGVSGLAQYSIAKFGEAFECVPRILAENAGQDSMQTITLLHAQHKQEHFFEGVDIKGTSSKTCDAMSNGILDHLGAKSWALDLAVDTVLTIIRLDHIIVARPAGGPAPRGPQAPDLDD